MGSALAFVSDRTSHSFIGVYSFATNTLEYLDPGSDHDRYPMWSPDSRQIAFIRVPYYKQENFDEPHRAGLPWSIRVADVASGKVIKFGKPIRARVVFSARLSAPNKCSGRRTTILIFPWERDGWTHLYAIPVQGGQGETIDARGILLSSMFP